MEGGTTFHFVGDLVRPALQQAFDAADGADVRLGGGAATIQQYLRTFEVTRLPGSVNRQVPFPAEL
jgi:dihydrofolate reductase